jgi:hypothetical protein
MVSQEEMRFVTENQLLSGYSGRIARNTEEHQPDKKEIAKSAIGFNAQIPGEAKRGRPRITRFGGQTL